MNSSWVTRILYFIVALTLMIMFTSIIIITIFSESHSDELKIANLQSPITVDESLRLLRERTMMNIQNVECIPVAYGIPEKEDYEIFTVYNKYDNCAELNPGSLSIINNTIFFNCKESSQFMFGKPTSKEIFGRYEMKFKWESKSKFENKSKAEWIFAKCSKTKQAFLQNVFNKTSARRAQKNSQEKASQYSKTSTFRPLTVLYILIDSVSRQSFFRNLPKTVDFINEQIVNPSSNLGKKFLIYDFLVNNAIGEKTPHNMAPILYGRTLEELENYLIRYSIFDENDWPIYEKLQEESIWRHYQRNGFVTLFSYDSYTDYISHFIGRKILADHVVCNFWRAAHQVFDYLDFTENSQCIGNQWAHDYTFNYITQYIENYKGLNKFAYAHFDIAHESTGHRLNVADESFIKFINDILGFYKKNNNEDLILIIGADHGRISTVMSKEAWQEKLLPFQFVFANRELITRTQSHDILIHNSDRLVSRFDWHKTLKHFALLPYSNKYYEDNVYKDYKPNRGISLIEQRVPDDRDCESEEIPAIFCSCIYNKNYIKYPLEDYFLEKMIHKAIRGVNNFFEENDAEKYCNNVKLGSILDAYEVFTTIKDPFSKKNYYVTISDLKHPDFILNLEIRYGLKNDFFYIPNKYGLKPYYEKKVYTQRGKPQVIVTQISSISNPNLLHKCDNLPKKLSKYHDLCDCKEKVKQPFSLYFISQSNKSCKDICRVYNQDCVDYKYVIPNYQTIRKALKQKDIKIKSIIEGDSFEVNGPNLVIPTSSYCNKISNNTSLLCACISNSL